MDETGDVEMEAGQEGAEKTEQQMEEEREKHRRRAQRFGTPYVEPRKCNGPKSKTPVEKQKKEKRHKGKNRPAGARVQDQISAEELEARKRRAEKFGPVQEMQPAVKKLKLINRPFPERLLLEGRIDADPSLRRRLDTVHMYGVDLMSSKDVLRYFTDYGPTYVEWINDSSCNIVFGDGGSAMRAISELGTPVSVPEAGAKDPPGESGGPNADEGMKMETDGPKMDTEDSKTEKDGATPDPNYVGMYHWHRGHPFIKSKEAPAIHLMFRMATNEDRKPDAPKQTRKLWRLPMSKATRIQKLDATEGGKGQQNVTEEQSKRVGMTPSAKKNLRKRQRRKAQKEKEHMGGPKGDDVGTGSTGGQQGVEDLRGLITRLRLSPASGKEGRKPDTGSKIEAPAGHDTFTMGSANNDARSSDGNLGQDAKMPSNVGNSAPMVVE
ncbi:unnamed protein product [Ostreobium quekettii]|uniref:Nuclear cap-binding protein subunit 3 n=1 Tax=Ostreobium quekettii TaxID=121088 RepID=A0A8S1ISL9_9CHLO|nr:unnamed protein product [Ostreobium quekettii]